MQHFHLGIELEIKEIKERTVGLVVKQYFILLTYFMFKLPFFCILREVRLLYQNFKGPPKGIPSTVGSQDNNKEIEHWTQLPFSDIKL